MMKKLLSYYNRKYLITAAVIFIAVFAACMFFHKSAYGFIRVVDGITIASVVELIWGLGSLVGYLGTFDLASFSVKLLREKRKLQDNSEFKDEYSAYARAKKRQMRIEPLCLGLVGLAAVAIMLCL